MSAVIFDKVGKFFGQVPALHSISAEISPGELFGFIGPDGSGKSTLFRILVTLLLPDTGRCEVLGMDSVRDFRRIRPICGYMPGHFSLYQDLTVEENLRFFATSFGTSIKENYHLIADIYRQIEPFKDRLAGKLSGGMKQKLALSCALIHQPQLLVLDEPTTGVDAISRKEFWDMLHRLKMGGLTIIVSTPYMDEASRCDRVALMQSGQILSIDTPQGLRNSYPKTLLRVKGDGLFGILSDIRSFGQHLDAHAAGDNIHVSFEGHLTTKDELTAYLQHKGHHNVQIEIQEPDTEDCFISFMERRSNA